MGSLENVVRKRILAFEERDKRGFPSEAVKFRRCTHCSLPRHLTIIPYAMLIRFFVAAINTQSSDPFLFAAK